MANFSIYDPNGVKLNGWTAKTPALAAAQELARRGMSGHYVVNEDNAEIVPYDTAKSLALARRLMAK